MRNKSLLKKVFVTTLALATMLCSIAWPTRVKAAGAKIVLHGNPDKTYTQAVPRYIYVGGKKVNFDYNINGKTKNIKGTWSSSNTKIAKVDKNGKVTAVGNGACQILFTYKMNGLTETLRTYVKGRTRAEEMEVYVASPKNFNGHMDVGDTIDIDRIFTPSDKALELNPNIKVTYKGFGTLYDDEDCTIEHDGSVAELGAKFMVTGISDGVVYFKANGRNSETNFDKSVDSNVIKIIVGEGSEEEEDTTSDITDSMKQTDVNKITVTSTSEITSVIVKRNNTVQSLAKDSPSISEDKHTAILTFPGNLMETTYTVYLNGEEKGTDVACTTRRLEKIELDSKYAVLDKLISTNGSFPKATVKYRLYDQFGIDITNNPNYPYTDFTPGGVFTPTAPGVLTYQYQNSYVTVGQKFDVVLVYSSGSTVRTVKEEVQIANPAYVDKVSFKGVYMYDALKEQYILKADEKNCYMSEGDNDIVAFGGEAKNIKTNGAYYILFKAEDQYGGNAAGAGVGYAALVVNVSGGITGLSLSPVSINGQSAVQSVDAITIDNVQYLAYPLAASKIKEGTCMIVANTIQSASGNKNNISNKIVINPKSGIKTFTVAQTETLYEAKETYLDYQIADINGNEVTNYSTLVKYCGLVDNGTYATFESNSNYIKSANGSTFQFIKQADGTAKLRYVPATKSGSSTVATNVVYIDSITTMQTSVNIRVFNYSIYAKPMPTKIYGIETDASLGALLGGNHVIIRQKDIQIVDQYGADMPDSLVKVSGYKAVITGFNPTNNSFITDSGVNKEVPFSSAQDGTDTGINKPIVDITTGTVAGSTTLKIELKDNAGNPLNASGFVVTVKSFDAGSLVTTAYTVKDFGPMFNGSGGESKQFEVYGIAADGTRITIPKSKITVYPKGANAGAFLTASGASDVVYGIDPTAKTLAELGYTTDPAKNCKTAIFDYIIVVDDGYGTTLNTKVTISDEAPYATSVKIMLNDKLAKGTGIWSQMLEKHAVTAYDQYGKLYDMSAAGSRDVVRVQLGVTSSFAVTKNGTTNATVTAGAGDIVANIYINDLDVISVPVTILE